MSHKTARVRCLRRLVWMFLLRLRSSHEEASNLPRGDGDIVATEDDGSAPQSTVAHASSAHARRRRGTGMMEMCNIGFPRARGESQLRIQLREKRMHRQRLASCGTVVRVTRARMHACVCVASTHHSSSRPGRDLCMQRVTKFKLRLFVPVVSPQINYHNKPKISTTRSDAERHGVEYERISSK